MKNLKMFCITMEPNHYQFIDKLGYQPVGLGGKIFDKKWITDKSGQNISKKNKNYGEYTFHYWIWKNYLNNFKNEWIGFCQYRKFWSLNQHNNSSITFNNLTNLVLKEIPSDFTEYESFIGESIFVNQFRASKFIKKGLKIFLKKPYLAFNQNKRNINFHFDLMHGENNLNTAINLLDKKNKEDFKEFVNTEVSFNPHNMFICKSKEILKNYYEDLFPWLQKCESIFGFETLKGYGKVRIYGFLAERFMSYWFKKYTKYKTLPIIFYDIRKDINY